MIVKQKPCELLECDVSLAADVLLTCWLTLRSLKSFFLHMLMSSFVQKSSSAFIQINNWPAGISDDGNAPNSCR